MNNIVIDQSVIQQKENIVIPELVILEDDPKVGNDIIKIITQLFHSDTVKIKPLLDYNQVNSWMSEIVKNGLSPWTILLCDFNFQNWEDKIKDFIDSPINDGSDVIRSIDEHYNEKTQIANIIYSKQTKHVNFKEFVEGNMPEETIYLSKDFEKTDELKNTLYNLINNVSPQEFKKIPDTQLIPVEMQFLYKEKMVPHQTVLIGLFKEITKANPSNLNYMAQIGNIACEFVDPLDKKIKREQVYYDDTILDLNFLMDIKDKNKVKGIRINRLNLLLSKEKKHFIQKTSITTAWEASNVYEKALISTFYPECLISFILNDQPNSYKTPEDSYAAEGYTHFDIPFKLQFYLELIKSLQNMDINKEEIEDCLVKWNAILGLELHEIMEFEVIESLESKNIVKCRGTNLLLPFPKEEQFFPIRILEDFGCSFEESRFLLFVYDNGTGIPTYSIEPII